MKIAVFLDVDKTLTRDFIQQGYARALGCEPDYVAIEQQLQSRAIDETEFGTRIISLFAAKGFTQIKAQQFFGAVTLQPWTDTLLHLKGVDKYLVSSGPNYYIDLFADRFGIPKEQVRASRYNFDVNSGLIGSCDAFSAAQKAQFVEEHSAAYDITIGVGDSPEFDGPFVSHCTIPLLTTQKTGYIYIADLNSAVLLIEKLARKEPSSAVEQPGLQDPKKLTIPQLWSSLSWETWAFLAGLFGGIGIFLGKILSQSK